MKNSIMDSFSSKAIQCISFMDETVNLQDDDNRYHYTSASAFLSIIKQKRIRFTDVRFMNDKSEGCIFIQKIFEHIIENNKKYPNTNAVLNTMFPSLKIDDIINLKNISSIDFYNEKQVNNIEKYRSFVFCSSKEPDSLNMWNYYVNNNKYEGFNFGFSVVDLLRSIQESKITEKKHVFCYYGNVLYNSKQQTDEIINCINYIEEKSDEYDIKTGVLLLNNMIESRGLFFKSKHFQNEKEFRILFQIKEKDIIDREFYNEDKDSIAKIDFCVKNGMIVPFFEIKINEDIIKRITISPTLEFDITKIGVKEMLYSNNFQHSNKNISIYKSKIPIRF